MLHCPQKQVPDKLYHKLSWAVPRAPRGMREIRSQLGQCAHLSRQLTDWQLACITQKHSVGYIGGARGFNGALRGAAHFPPGCQRSSLWLTVSFNWLWSIYCCQFDKSMQANVAQVGLNCRIEFSFWLNWNADESRLQAAVAPTPICSCCQLPV